MLCRLVTICVLSASLCPAVIIDQIAIVAGKSIVKDSDIERDIRMTDFMNGQPLSFSPSARKTAASRLLDQAFIRQEILTGDYPRATPDQAEKQLEELEHHRFRTQQMYQAALKRYGLTDLEVRQQFQWQLTVLSFIDIRFKPAAYITDEQVADYYKQHAAELRREHPGKTTLQQLRPAITDILSGERVNKLFFDWLDNQKKNTKIKYFEEGLE